jgi:superfamily II DNA/RNA helicase
MNTTAENTHSGTEAGFEALGVHPDLIAALQRLKLDAPTQLQRQMIPAVLEGKDCLARASTGAGKTNTYLLPILQTVTPGESVQALVIQPTRSLALQFQRNLQRFAPERPVRTAVALGGRPSRDHPDPLAQSPDVLITIPRGAGALARRKSHDWSSLRLLVIDEVDAILDERGADQLKQVHAALAHEHQTILLAGNLDEPVRELAAEILRDPIEVDLPPGPPRSASASQSYFAVDPEEKFDALLSFCKQESPRLAIVLTNTAEQAREVARRLERARVSCRWIGEQPAAARRERHERRGPRARSEVIIASDPAPRRLSTIPASHLLHYEMPRDIDTYMYRLEQAPRLRKHGHVIAFVEPTQETMLAEIAQRVGKPLDKREPLEHPKRRRHHQKAESAHSRDSQPAPKANHPKPKPETRGRLREVLHRDEDLEARGVQPPPRTLGSRFRTGRRGKPLRRPGSR